jgi:PAS domain S-box-containing protein
MQVIDQKQVESLLAAERRTLEMIAGGASLTDVLEDLCDTIDDQAPEIISSVLLMDPNGERLWPTAGRRVPEGWVRTITPLPIGPGMGSCGTAAFLKKPVIISDIASDPPWSDITAPDYTAIALSYGLRAAWSQPLISKDNELLGTFAIYYREPRQPSDSDLKLIEGAANIAVIAIKGERSQTALKNAFEEIKQSEARLRKIIDTIPTLAWCGLPDASKEFFNKRWHDYTGLSPEEASGWGWKVTIHPDDLEKLMDRSFKFIASEEPGEVEARMRRFDGEYRWFLFRAEPLRDEHGNVVNWYGTNTDIEDRKRAEEKLRQDEMELRQITDAITQTIMVLAPDGTGLLRQSVDARFQWPQDARGYGSGLSDTVFSSGRCGEAPRRTPSSPFKGPPVRERTTVRRRDGQYRWFLIQYKPLRNEQGRDPSLVTLRAPISKIESKPKKGCEVKTWRYAKKSTALRCSKKSSVHRSRYTRYCGKSPGGPYGLNGSHFG